MASAGLLEVVRACGQLHIWQALGWVGPQTPVTGPLPYPRWSPGLLGSRLLLCDPSRMPWQALKNLGQAQKLGKVGVEASSLKMFRSQSNQENTVCSSSSFTGRGAGETHQKMHLERLPCCGGWFCTIMRGRAPGACTLGGGGSQNAFCVDTGRFRVKHRRNNQTLGQGGL